MSQREKNIQKTEPHKRTASVGTYKKQRGRQPNGEPNKIDIYVGKRLLQRRNMLNITQEIMAQKLGSTSQRIQKYEKGFYRISVGRLWEISRILNVPIAYFFEDLPRSSNEQNTEISGFGDEAQMIYKEDSLRLLNAFNKIRNPQTARIVFDLLQALVATPKEAEYEPRKK